MKKLNILAGLAAAVVGGLMASSNASAVLLNGGLGLIPDRPDVAVGGVRVTYVASTRVLTITGTPSSILYPNGSTTPVGTTRSFNITATLSSDPVPTITSGTISLVGTVATVNQTLISSNQPLLFGFGSSKLEFVFLNNTGTLNTGQGIGVIVTNTTVSPTPGGLPSTFNFNSNFTTNFAGVADAWVPEPAALGVLAPAALALGRRRRMA